VHDSFQQEKHNMTDASETAGQRDRSPAYPNISLQSALERLGEFDAHFKRSPARAEKIGDAWGIKGKAYVDRTTAALRYFGLLEYQGTGKDRRIVLSEEGRKYLRAQQEETKREVIKGAALRPKQIAKFWGMWGRDRPADAACLDDLAFKYGFSQKGARDFLRIYDETITFAGLSESDKSSPETGEEEPDYAENEDENADIRQPPKGKLKTMAGERELTTGLLSKDANFRLIVSGPIGVKEIERLIKKLEFDKEILADQNENPDDPSKTGGFVL
jgi:hypothetical protein